MTLTRAAAAALTVFVAQLVLTVARIFLSLGGPFSIQRALIPTAGDYAAMAAWALAAGALVLLAGRLRDNMPGPLLPALKARRVAVLRLGLLLAAAFALRGAAMQGHRSVYSRSLPPLLEVLDAQRNRPELFLGAELSDDFIRKTAAVSFGDGRQPTVDELRRYLSIGNTANYLGAGLDRYDHNVERFLLQHPQKAADEIAQRIGQDVEGLTWARGGFVLERLPGEHGRLLSELRWQLTQQEASEYGRHRARILAGTMARLAPYSPGLLRHLNAALRDASLPQLRIMAAETLGGMGFWGWPAAPALVQATFALEPAVSAAARRAILRSWLLPVFPFAALEAVQALVTPFGAAALVLAGSFLAFGALGAWSELEPDQRAAKWLLFWALCCSVPTLAFYIVAAGFVPAVMYPAGIVLILLSGDWYDLGFVFALNTVHFAVYGGLFYVVASLGSWLLYRIPAKSARLAALFGLAGALALTALLPIYLPVAHNSPGASRNILGLLRP